MEDLEPWNMFTNDIVTDATETGNDSVSNKTIASNETKVKEEPEDVEEEEAEEETNPVENYTEQVVKDELKTPPRSNENECDDEPDDTIFNFGLEPLVNIAESSENVPITPIVEMNDSSSQSENEVPINYENAVVYICPACGSEFDTQDAWKRHMNAMHNFNTRRGLNFIQIDKLYHQCLECHKRIAMHAMENLLKHKFTHLPYRCTKCKICLRQYKYRQDLMVHLRMTHRDDLVAMAKTEKNQTPLVKQSMPRTIHLEIKDIKENAVDIYDCDNIKVKNELIEPDDDDSNNMADKSNSIMLPSFLEDALSRSSSHASERQSVADEDSKETNIQYVCSKCGVGYNTQSQWRQHVEFVHQVRSSSQHAYKPMIRCKLCFRSFIAHEDVVKHLMKQHRLSSEFDADESQTRDGYDDTNTSDNILSDQSSKNDEKDPFEPHIDYLCPQCGREFFDKKLWRVHIVKSHQLTNLEVLNFKVINDRQVMCLECEKIITNAYGVQNAQQHRITHMPYKSFIRCRLCAKSYTDRKGLVKHLRSSHRIGAMHGFDVNAVEPSPSTLQQQKPQISVRVLPQKNIKPQTPKKPQKEIVRHANYIYEIQYLDEDDDCVIDDAPVPELSFSNSIDQLTRLKCSDCGSIFSTQEALQTHINEEHEFLDFNNLKPMPDNTANSSRSYSRTSMDTSNSSFTRDSSTYNALPQDEQSNDADDLLKPTGEEENNLSQDSWNIERNFCYLCPACGVLFKAQSDWRRHINNSHNFDKRHFLSFKQIDKFRFQCTICNDIVSSPKLKGFQDHKFRHLPYKLYIKCLICGTCYNHKPNMITHLRVRHNINDGRLSPIQNEREFDLTSQNNLTNRSLNLAPASTSAAIYPKPPGLKTVEDAISYHNAVDLDFITYYCPQCNENFNSHVFWRKHIVEEHGFNSRAGLNFRQIDQHHFLCLQCYKRVTVTHTKGAIGQLQSHKFRHLPYKSFKCLTCNGEFVRKQMFFKHLNRQTNRCDNQPILHNDFDEFEKANTTDTENEQEQVNADNLPRSEHSDSQSPFILLCPQCGKEFDTWRPWREHINSEHNLGKREALNIKKISPILHECLQCNEQINGNKLRDLQGHKFKHLSYGAYIRCKSCDAAYYHLRAMERHVESKHPHMIDKNDMYQKMLELQQYDDTTLNDTNEANDFSEVENIQDETDKTDDQFPLGQCNLISG
ncbi:zinc finger protein Xfin [Teleopsis dalmanni]|uniref:zinc finger protein Xfin n=1 Tax=Teleopsis dalmanni TaxID=139649 RepID=UPI0018CFECCA|nr:zinc finger protein Xfin [Teleopsis dalmanni]